MMTEEIETTPNVAPAETATAPATADAAPAPEAAAASATPTSPSKTTVLVENLSSSVTTKTLNDFFSLCGAISSITLRPANDADDVRQAVVSFETAEAASTAVLLTNAILVDRAINIRYFDGQVEASGSDVVTIDGTDLEQRPYTASDDQRVCGSCFKITTQTSQQNNTHPHTNIKKQSKTSVVASMLAAGYKLNDDIRARALEYDRKHGVSQGFHETVDRIDQTLGISEKWNAMTAAAQKKSEELHVPEKMSEVGAAFNRAGQALSDAATQAVNTAMQNQYVSSAWAAVAGWGASIAQSWNSVTSEANAIYNQQKSAAASTETEMDEQKPKEEAAAPETPKMEEAGEKDDDKKADA